jgi:hypothetical protein
VKIDAFQRLPGLEGISSPSKSKGKKISNGKSAKSSSVSDNAYGANQHARSRDGAEPHKSSFENTSSLNSRLRPLFRKRTAITENDWDVEHQMSSTELWESK